jgi:hypothetical protein
MTAVEPFTDATTSTHAGAYQRWTQPVVVGLVLAAGAWGVTGTTAAQPHDVTAAWTGVRSQFIATDASPRERNRAFADRVRLLKLRSGLSWMQVAEVFGVSRRAVHFWVQGGNMNGENAARLGHVEAVVARHDLGEGRATRASLLSPSDTGVSDFTRLLLEVHLAMPDDALPPVRPGSESGRESYTAGQPLHTEPVDLPLRNL